MRQTIPPVSSVRRWYGRLSSAERAAVLAAFLGAVGIGVAAASRTFTERFQNSLQVIDVLVRDSSNAAWMDIRILNRGFRSAYATRIGVEVLEKRPGWSYCCIKAVAQEFTIELNAAPLAMISHVVPPGDGNRLLLKIVAKGDVGVHWRYLVRPVVHYDGDKIATGPQFYLSMDGTELGPRVGVGTPTSAELNPNQWRDVRTQIKRPYPDPPDA